METETFPCCVHCNHVDSVLWEHIMPCVMCEDEKFWKGEK